MKKFWSYILNDKYSVGCTGSTVHVYDNMLNEVAKFKDLQYAYLPMFAPTGDMFIVKSTDGRIAVYSLEKRKLVKKFRFSSVTASQDDGCCFSYDGNYFYNIERHIDTLHTRISVYNTHDYSIVKTLFENEPIFLRYIECDYETKKIYVIGDIRNRQICDDYGFVAELKEDKLVNMQGISEKEYDYICGHKSLELKGFTEKAKQWSGLYYMGYDMEKIINKKLRLADHCLAENGR